MSEPAVLVIGAVVTSSRRIDTKVEFAKRIEAIKHLRGQGFGPTPTDTWVHGEFKATLMPVEPANVNGKTLIAWNPEALAAAKAA